MRISDIMTTNPKTLRPNANVQKAAEMMRDQDVGSIPIVDEIGSLVGIVTDRDIVLKVIAEGNDSSTKIEDVMSRNPESAPPDTPLDQAIRLMSHRQIRRLPVVEYGKLIGMVSLADIATSSADVDDKADTLAGVSEGGFDRHNADVTAISQY